MNLRLLLACLVLLTSAACGKNDNPLGRLPISGEVTLKGAPLKKGTIQFSPTDPNQGIATGTMIMDGTYSIPAEQGLPPGTYIVRISASSGEIAEVEPGGDATNIMAKELIPPEYNTDTKQSVEVKQGVENKFDYRIE